MHIVLGASGHIGTALTHMLLERGEAVTVVTRDAAHVEDLRRRGAQVGVADVHDTEALRAVFRRGKRAFLLNPPADPSTDIDAEERRTAASIVAAVAGSGLEKVVVESTYGAQLVEHAGDLGVLFDMEEALRAQRIPTSVIRAAYYLSNWDSSLETAREEGVINTLFPVTLTLPMVAPQDLGRAAFSLMTAPVAEVGVHYVEGPARYAPADVAAAFAAALGTPVEAVSKPREAWVDNFKTMGFSDTAADSYARMTALTLASAWPPVEEVEAGRIALDSYIRDLVERQQCQAHQAHQPDQARQGDQVHLEF